MGWFDKKSWQLRRKIRDLQSELAVAERDGKYVVEQGLFFAELQEMGDATLMVLGTADHLDSEEEDIIRNFFDRNGFTVETLRLDRTQKTLAAVEILPPEELTRRVARVLKEGGYRVVDDSDQERPSNLERQTVTLSSLVRAISALFASHVHHLIISTPIKMNMEGNRLLHWMPLIREALLRKVPQDVVTLCRDPFVNAYNHYYGRFGEMADPENFQFTDEPSDAEPLSVLEPADADQPAATTESDSSTDKWTSPADARGTVDDLESDTEPTLFLTPAVEGRPSEAVETLPPGNRSADAAFVLAKMYKSLIGATAQRRVRNAEILLDNICHFFEARAACLLARPSVETPFKVQANSGKSVCLETRDDGTVTCDTEFLRNAIMAHAITVQSPTGNGDRQPTAVIVPLEMDFGSECVLYLLDPKSYSAHAESGDAHYMSLFSQVFREFPDLVLPGNISKKT